jgi:hypothetical protein
MDKFLKKIKYNTIKFFANILVGIAYICAAYPLWALVFFQHINPITTVITFILSWVIGLVGGMIIDDNDKNNKVD